MIQHGDDVINVDTSGITDMSSLFYYQNTFNQDISNWDVSNVTDMSHMFSNTYYFNQNLSSWNVSSVTDMYSMFYNASGFTGHDLSGWDVDYTDDARTATVSHTDFSTDWGTGNIEPHWVQ